MAVLIYLIIIYCSIVVLNTRLFEKRNFAVSIKLVPVFLPNII